MTSAIFLHGARGDEYVIVDKRDVLDMWSRSSRRRLIDDIGDAAIRAVLVERPRWANSTALEDVHAEEDECLFALEELLAFNRIVAVRIEPIWHPLHDPLPSVRLRDLIKPKPEDPLTTDPSAPTRSEQTFTYEVRLVDEIGVPLDGVPLSLSLSGSSRRFTTDGEGRIRVDDAGTSTALVQLPDIHALREAARPRWEQVRDGSWLTESEDHTYIDCAAPLPMVKVAAGRLHTIVVQPRVICARILELLFDTNKSFLLPSALEHIHSVVDLYLKRPTDRLLIVGHTDVTGEPSINDPLSLNRARSVQAYLTDDVETWLGFYGAHMPPKARWGALEDHAILDAILSATGENLSDTRVRHFQRSRGLKVDGQVGDETRRALIAEYMAFDGTTLPPSIVPTIHGCGENFPLDRADESKPVNAYDRRVELFFFDQGLGVLPPVQGEVSPPGSVAYLEWRRRSTETHEFEVRNAAAIELVFVDDTEAAIPRVACRLTRPDGKATDVVSDDEGRARIPNAAPGQGLLELLMVPHAER